jgi:signal transduction histidine kinase
MVDGCAACVTTEELRPSILDNFGLFAALRWLHLEE